jgi:type III restriction enzyme
MSFVLRDFQEKAVAQLQKAAADWTQTIATTGVAPRAGRVAIPLLGQLIAITGSGKTPILAKTIGAFNPAIVFWTTRSTILVQQTAENLRGRYRHLLPANTTILDEVPSPSEWYDLLNDKTGITIWVRTVASWNEPDQKSKNTAEARLNLHRPAPDWAGKRSPWDQLSDRKSRTRPLWVVYDEGHGQTDVQLDQLVDLNPVGLLAATGTPVLSGRFQTFEKVLGEDKDFGPILTAATVRVPTSEVAKAGLLKTVVKVVDLDLDSTTKIDSVVIQQRRLDDVANKEPGGPKPRSLYVVEESNLRKGAAGEPRPIVIWRALHERCHVPAAQIALATNTKDPPKEVEEVQDFSSLKPRHRHVIFNKKLQEGWDDPEAYIAYFDGETNSALRLAQLIGRVIRQPGGNHFSSPELNTAYLFVSSRTEKFAQVVSELQRQLISAYGADDSGEPNIKVVTKKEERPPIPLRKGIPKLKLPRWTLGGAKLDDALENLREEGDRPFKKADLNAPGQTTAKFFDLTDEDMMIVEEAKQVGFNIRTENRAYLLTRVDALSRAARNTLDPNAASLAGSMYGQEACANSKAQQRLDKLAREYVETYETRVGYERNPNPFKEWTPGPFPSRSGETVGFKRSVHVRYPAASTVFNADEQEMARALDAVGAGWWARNTTTATANGYGIPLPSQVGTSGVFYPDFLWWIDKTAWAIETTGRFLLEEKVRGKLLSVEQPRIVIVTRGKIADDWQRTESAEGWTLVRPSKTKGHARSEHYASLNDVLGQLRKKS